MTNVLVLGGEGQLGRELRRRAPHFGVGLVASSRSSVDITDMTSLQVVIAAVRPHLVINAAAYTQVDRAETESDLAWRINCEGAGAVADVCVKAGLPLIHLSTDFVFDGMKPAAYVEDDPVGPLGVYAASKEAGERAVRARCADHVIVRTAWVFGRFGSNFLKTMLRLARERDSWGVVNDQLGTPTASEDLADALLTAALRLARGGSGFGTYHFAGASEATWFEFAEEIVRVQAHHTRRRARVRPISTTEYPTAARRPPNSRLCSDRFARSFGYRAAPTSRRVREAVEALLGHSEAAT